MNIKITIAFSVVFISGLILWGIKPIQKTNIQLVYTNDTGFPIPDKDCPEIYELLKRKWEVSFPSRLPKGESETITVDMLEDLSSTNLKIVDFNSCTFALEIRLDLPALSKNIAEKIISPYEAGSLQHFGWEILGSEGIQRGTLWIVLLYGNETGQFARFPLFSVPIEIEGVSYFGIGPRVIRLFILFLVIIGLLIANWKYVNRSNDII